jgi:hypothetical protein
VFGKAFTKNPLKGLMKQKGDVEDDADEDEDDEDEERKRGKIVKCHAASMTTAKQRPCM